MELQKLIIAGNDLSEILGIKDPPINTAFVFESKARGAAYNTAKAKAEKEFVAALTNEIKEVIEFKDDSGNYDLQAGDIPRLKAETKEVIIEISADTAERLKEVLASPAEATKNTKPKATKTPTPKIKKEKTKSKSIERAEFLLNILSAPVSKNEIIEKLHKDFKDSDTESRYQATIAINYLITFGAIKEENDKFSIA